MTRWQMFKEAVHEYRQGRREERALRMTTELLSQMHPLWHASLFDEPFLRKVGARRLLTLTPRELAYEWSRQFSYRDARRREREVRRVTEIADQLLTELRQAVSRMDGEAVRSATAERKRGGRLGTRAAARL